MQPGGSLRVDTATLQSPSRDPCMRVWDVCVTCFLPEDRVCGGVPTCKGGPGKRKQKPWVQQEAASGEAVASLCWGSECEFMNLYQEFLPPVAKRMSSGNRHGLWFLSSPVCRRMALEMFSPKPFPFLIGVHPSCVLPLLSITWDLPHQPQQRAEELKAEAESSPPPYDVPASESPLLPQRTDTSPLTHQWSRGLFYVQN